MSTPRWAGPGDKADVERLFMEYLALQGESQDRLGFAQTWRESLRSRSRFRFAVVDDEGTRVAAFATVHESYSTHAAGPAIRIEDLFVDPDYSGRGNRSRLIAFVEEYARRNKAKHVEVSLQAETSLDTEFLPGDYHPLASPPFRRLLGTSKRPRRAAPTTKPARRTGRTSKRSRPRRVPTGRQLTALFRQTPTQGEPKPK